MRNIRIAIGMLMLLFAFVTVQAQTGQADRLVQQSKVKYEGLKDLKASFIYTLSNPNMKKPIVKQGDLTLKGNKYKIVFRDEEMYCDGKYLMVKLNEDEEIIKSDVDPEGSLSPDRLYAIYEQDTKTKYEGVIGDTEKVSLFAKSKKGDIWKTELWINKRSKLIDKAVMHARNGSQYMYEMKNIKMNTGVSDGVFQLDLNKYEAEDWIITDQSEM